MTYPVDPEVEVVGDDAVTVKKATVVLALAVGAAGSLENHELLEDILFGIGAGRRGVEEGRKLSSVDRRVELEQVADIGHTADGENVRKEELEVALDSVGRRVGHPSLESLGVLVGRGVDREVLGASLEEELLEHLEGLITTTLERGELVTVVLLDNSHDAVVRRAGRESGADGEEGVHALRLLGDRTVLVTPGVVLLHAEEEDQDRDKGLDRVGPAAESHVGTADVVVGGHMAGSDASEEGTATQLDVLHGLEGEGRVAQENVDAEQADEREVTEVAVQRLGAVLASNVGNLLGALALLLSTELLVDLRLLDKRVEDVEDRVARPNLRRLGEHVELVLRLVLGVGTPLGERLELVHKLVKHVPEPLDGQVEGNGAVRVEEVVEQLANVLVRLEAVVNGRLETRVDVTEVELKGKSAQMTFGLDVVSQTDLAVKGKEDLVVLDEGSNQLSLGPLGLLVVSLRKLVGDTQHSLCSSILPPT